MSAIISPPPRKRPHPAPVTTAVKPEALADNQRYVLKAFAAQGGSRHPEDICRAMPNAHALAYELAGRGYLYRSPATGYFTITDEGIALLKTA